MALPRVTEVLQPFSGFKHVPKQILENAAARGTTVHALCAAMAKGSWMPESMIEPEVLGYVKSFREWAEAKVKEFVLIEERYNDEGLGYTGQLDYVIKDHDNRLWLVDLKTSAKHQPTYPVQMAAYWHLLWTHDIVVHGALLVYLDREGAMPEEYVMEDFVDEWITFDAALKCYHYFNRGKRERNKEHIPETDRDNE